MTSCSKEHRPGCTPKATSTNYNSDSKEPDFKFELLPLHSQLLRQSLLVSFPPLIDMLKFSGYPYLIRSQTLECWGLVGWTNRSCFHEKRFTTRRQHGCQQHWVSPRPSPRGLGPEAGPAERPKGL